MNSKEIALIIVFTAVTVVLNPRFSGFAIPSFVPTLWFQIWEIAVVTAFFLLGTKSGVAIAILNTAVLVAVSPGIPFNKPLANLVAILSTLLGVYVAYRLVCRTRSQEMSIPSRKLVLSSTMLGIIFRLAIMIPFLYVSALLLARPFAIILLPFIAIYDLIVALYTVPLGYIVAKLVAKRLKLASKV